MSQLIVAMDEALEERMAHWTEAAVEAMATQTRLLLAVSEEATVRPNIILMHCSAIPKVVLAHADVAKLINPQSKKR